MVNVEYLNQEYLELYHARFGLRLISNVDAIHDRIEVFATDVIEYLRINGDIRVTSYTVFSGNVLSPIVTLYLEVLTRPTVVVGFLYMRLHHSINCVYEVQARRGKRYIAFDIRALPSAIQKAMYYEECNSCHYSDRNGIYCGMGVGMYTPDCGSRIPRDQLLTLQEAS
jgi:hypothetical protein